MQTLKCFLLMKTILSTLGHTIIITSKKEVGLLQVNESIVMQGEKHGFNFSEIFKSNWQKRLLIIHYSNDLRFTKCQFTSIFCGNLKFV